MARDMGNDIPGLDTTTPITLSVEELTVTDSVPDFSGSPLGPTGFRVFWPKNSHRFTDRAELWPTYRGDLRAPT